ncbi:Conserved oligomeric Golgi complex subunit 5 [Nymphon striatum]|nr:Conserved oligomeric Golgi complex subunit 5 [Nymphon striatum]
MRTEEKLLKRLKERKMRFAGHVMRGSSRDLLNLILEGSIEGFLSDNFDAKSYASKAIQNTAVAQERAKLIAGINLVDKELHDQVSLHYEDLLSQATRIETLEGVLQMMHNRIHTLVYATDRLRNKIIDPFSKMANQTAMLSRLQSVCEILRRILRIMYLSKRLQTQLKGGAREITKAAQSLSELENLCQGVNLSGIDVIDKDQRIIRNARKEVEKQAQSMLHFGMESQNQSQVATSLQVFHNMNNLSDTVNKIIIDAKDDLQRSVIEALDMKMLSSQNSANNLSTSKNAPGHAAIPTIGNTASFRAALWTNIEKMMDKIYSNCGNIQHLHSVLAKKRDPVSHICFLDELKKDGYSNIMQSFWDMVTAILMEEFNKSAEESSFVKQAFEGEYPKLLRLYSDLWKRLEQLNLNMKMNSVNFGQSIYEETSQDIESESQVLKFDPEKALRDTLIPFENAYLSRSLSRLFDPINLVFSSANNTAPTKEEIDNIVRTISSELSVASVDSVLSKTVANNIAKTIKLFTVKCEQQLSTDGEASQVIGPQNVGQALNCNIVNTLELFHQQVISVIESLTQYPVEAKAVINEALVLVILLMKSAVQPLISSISDAIESIILTMHNEDFSGPAPGGDAMMADTPCSLYMKELQSFISRVQSDYLSQFTCTDFILKCIHPVACRAIDLFVQHASLVRPLGDGGKMRLAADFAQMEMAITPVCNRVGDLGKSYRMLRSFRPLLFQTVDHILNSPSIGSTVPCSLVLHFLFAKAAPELKSPHQVMGWSVSRYSQWLDENQSEPDRLNLIQGTLEAYVKAVNERGDRQFTSMYPVIFELLQKAVTA